MNKKAKLSFICGMALTMLAITNQSILSLEESRVSHLLDESNFISLEQWQDSISDWLDDYELGVFDDLKIEPFDSNYDSTLKEFYNTLNDKLAYIADLLFTSWLKAYNQN